MTFSSPSGDLRSGSGVKRKRLGEKPVRYNLPTLDY